MEANTPQPRPVLDGTGIFLLFFTLCVFLVPIFIFFPPFPPSTSDAVRQTHVKVGVDRRSKSSRKSPREPDAASPNGDALARIESLWIYPVKSCRGIEVARSKVLPTGLEFDRLFTFAQLKSPFPLSVDSSNEEKTRHRWEFITQRQFPLLATVRVDLYLPDFVRTTGRPADEGDDRPAEPFLILTFPWRQTGLLGALGWLVAKLRRGPRAVPEKEILLPVTFPSEEQINRLGYTREEVTIWKDTVTALNMEAELPRELRLYLGVSNKLALFRIDPGRLREVYRCAPRKAEVGYQPITGFQDAYPLHMLNLASVRDLDSKIAKDDGMTSLDARRFRANIIIDGAEEYDEDTWKSIRFRAATSGKSPDCTCHVSCRTVRCKMPNVHPESGLRHPVEPDKSLRKLRSVDEGAPRLGCLGMQLTPLFDEPSDNLEDMHAWLEAGMTIQVLERGDHRYIPQ